ncbi:STAS domain-containing protein [Phormidesmis priestleyi]
MGSRSISEEFLLQPQGRLDSRGGSHLRQQLETVASQFSKGVSAPRCRKLWVVDMSCIEFIDSFGLASLVAGLNVATQVGARLVLCGLRPSAQLVFEITQLDRAFTIFESYDALLASLEVSTLPALPTLEVA